jgi:outer membrane biosynthesis protein TonB
MSTFNPLSVRTFVAHRQIQRKTRARFRVATGILLSLLLHGGLLWYVLSVAPEPLPEGTTTAVQAPMMITLLQSKQTPSANAPSPTPPEPVRSSTQPKPHPQKAVKRSVPRATPRPATPPLPQSPSAAPAPTADISTMLNAARARRQQTEQADTSDDDTTAEKSDKAPSGNEVAQANINFSLRKNKGYGGVFQITSIGPRVGMFIFRGWNVDAVNSTRQDISVDAGLGGDVQMAVIARMIVLIREHYKGNFQWDSRRLGKVVTMSARPADEAGLREFMRQEFFGSGEQY